MKSKGSTLTIDDNCRQVLLQNTGLLRNRFLISLADLARSKGTLCIALDGVCPKELCVPLSLLLRPTQLTFANRISIIYLFIYLFCNCYGSFLLFDFVIRN